MTTTDTFTWIDTRKELPPLRTAVACIVKGIGIINGTYVIGPGKVGMFRISGNQNKKPEKVIAWCHFPPIPDWAKDAPRQEDRNSGLTPEELAQRFTKFDNDTTIYRIAREWA